MVCAQKAGQGRSLDGGKGFSCRNFGNRAYWFSDRYNNDPFDRLILQTKNLKTLIFI